MKQLSLIASALIASTFLATSVTARENAPPETIDGMKLVPDTRMALVYADPGVDLSTYDQLLLIDAQVAFRKNWQRDINRDTPVRVSDEDMQRIKGELSALFREIFSRELEMAGFELVEHQAPNVMIVRPAILDLNVAAPETASSGRTRNIQQTAGDMTLFLELRDSITGDILVKALDFQFDRSNVTPFMMDSTRNENAARRILTNWAQVLVMGLREARVATSFQQ
jgi:hypothetical protein